MHPSSVQVSSVHVREGLEWGCGHVLPEGHEHLGGQEHTKEGEQLEHHGNALCVWQVHQVEHFEVLVEAVQLEEAGGECAMLDFGLSSQRHHIECIFHVEPEAVAGALEDRVVEGVNKGVEGSNLSHGQHSLLAVQQRTL